MRQTTVSAWSSARAGALTLGAGAILIALTVAVASTHRHRGDNYCGAVLYDSQWHPPCDDAMRSATGVTVVLLVGGCGALLMGVWLIRRRLVTAAVLWTVAGLAVAGAANRVLEPASERYCGSIVNRHHSSDQVLERECDEYLRPHLVAAGGLGLSAVALGWLAVRSVRHASPSTGSRGMRWSPDKL